MPRDVAEVSMYWQTYEGPLRNLQTALNDLYLKSNHVEGGVQAYSHSVRLLEAWFDTAHGRAVLAGENPTATEGKAD